MGSVGRLIAVQELLDGDGGDGGSNRFDDGNEDDGRKHGERLLVGKLKK